MAEASKKTAKAAASTAAGEVKEPVKKTTARKTTTRKTAETAASKTAETAAKAPAKKPARKTAAKKPVQPEAVVHFQFDGKDLVAADLLQQAVKAYEEGHKDQEIKTIELYVVASEHAAYYVVNGQGSDDFKILL